MSGKVKRKYDHESVMITKKITQGLKQIEKILPREYNKQVILDYYTKYYPFDWKSLEERQSTYQGKDKFLVSKGKKKRYHAKNPEQFFYSLPKVKQIDSKTYKEKHFEKYTHEEVEEAKKEFEKKRFYKLNAQKEKIEQAKLNTQNVNPSYLDDYIQDYHQRGTTTEEKLVIVTELSKFDTPNITTFFSKLNDAERNNQIRNIAFKHLQDMGHYVKLRKNFKGKKKKYETEVVTLKNKRPEDLYNNIQEKNIHSTQRFNYFISHSSKDKGFVRETIKALNKNNKVCYCDWSVDDTHLKRVLANEYTKEVLKIRMEQSDRMIYLQTNHSEESEWVKFELDYFKSLEKPIITVKNVDDLELTAL